MKEMVREIVARVVPGVDVSELQDDQSFKEFGIDSLDVFSIIAEIDSEIGFAISDEDAERCDSINGILGVIDAMKR